MSERVLAEPDAELWIDRGTRRFAPGDRVAGGYRLGGWRDAGVVAVELSVVWYTSGQGEEDFFVTHFERHRAATLPPAAADTRYRFEANLPETPHSYSGRVLRVGWAARLRGCFAGGVQRLVETPFVVSPGSLRETGADG